MPCIALIICYTFSMVTRRYKVFNNIMNKQSLLQIMYQLKRQIFSVFLFIFRQGKEAALEPVINNKVGLFLGAAGAANAVPLESGGIDQARGVVAGWVTEHRTGIGLIGRLRTGTPVQQLADAHLEGIAGAGGQTQEIGRAHV